MTEQKIDVDGIFTTLAAVRKQVPHLADTPPRDAASTPTLLATAEEAMELFELETLADALESFAGEISDSIETAQQKPWPAPWRSTTPRWNWRRIPSTRT